MEQITEPKYTLAQGTQVRDEDFGLLFYTTVGPRLYFLSSGKLLESSFFQGKLTIDQSIREHTEQSSVAEARILGLKKLLNYLKEKGVLLGC